MSARSVHAVLARVLVPAASSARDRIAAQRAGAWLALEECARRVGVAFEGFAQDARGVPLPRHAWHWSISHARALAGAALDREPVGFDVERIRAPRAEIRDLVLSRAEAELLGGDDALAFTRAWTAKEAVLKRAAVGLVELSKCRVVELLGDGLLAVRHGAQTCRVHQRELDGHVAALATLGSGARCVWHRLESPAEAAP